MDKSKTLIILLGILLIGSLALNVILSKKTESGLTQNVMAAEQLFNLEFSAAERDSLLDEVTNAIENYKAINEVEIPNSVPPAFIFSPVPLAYKPNFSDNHTDYVPPRNVKLPLNSEDLCFYTVAELSELIRTRQVTSLELTQMYLGRLKRFDSKLFCVVTLLEDRAIEHAKAMDKELQAGKYRGPLHGIPYGAKDLLALEGVPLTFGSAIYKEQIPTITSPVIEKLHEAGAILLAKLSLGELAWGDVWHGGKTRNPWNPETGSSGSSAGSASAVAAGLVPFAIGSETWGSIVSPSTVCGVTGLRPTFGRVSRTGAMALSWTMDKIGPIARTAQDCAIVLGSISGLDGIDPTLADVPLNLNLARDPRKLRVGYTKDYFGQEYSMKTNDSLALQTLKSLGIELIPVTISEKYPVSAISFILTTEAAAAFSDLTLTGKDDLMVRQAKRAWPNTFRAARLIPAVEYLQANRIRSLIIEEFSGIFNQVDVMVTPSFVGDQLLMTNLTGHPALSVPTGFSEDGMPTSITIVGNWFREDNVLLLGKAFQEKTNFFRKKPKGF